MLNIGENAPNFTLMDDSGARVSLSSLLASGPVVLYFYPADFTPVCTAEACMFRDWTAELAAAGVRVIGISPQGAESKRKFKEKHALSFPLLADPEKEAIHAYGADFLFGMFTRRVTYLVEIVAGEANGPVRGVVADRAVADLSVKPHEAFVKRVLARFGSVAGA
ncbi:MAG: peroxiredoxin [Phycisphaeraceae bacterium]|nr:peroxiredoxin [Phycisphaeraceae bacterium]